jgi:hypothetical protein
MNRLLKRTNMDLKYLQKAVAMLIAVILTGCAETRKAPKLLLQMVDSSTQRPIHGVQVTRHSYSNNVLGGSREQDAVYGITDDNGMIVASDLTHGRLHYFKMQHPDYIEMNPCYAPDLQKIIVMLPGDERQRIWPLRTQNVIPMVPRPATTRPADTQPDRPISHN